MKDTKEVLSLINYLPLENNPSIIGNEITDVQYDDNDKVKYINLKPFGVNENFIENVNYNNDRIKDDKVVFFWY